MRRIKVRSIPEIFLYSLYTKEYCEQNETLESFCYFLENFVNESRARGTARGLACGRLCELIQ